MKVRNLNDVVLWLDKLKQYIDLQNQDLVKRIPQDREEQFSGALAELGRKLMEVQSSIPNVPDIPEAPDLTPLHHALKELESKIDLVSSEEPKVTNVTQVIREEVDTASIFEAFSTTIANVKQEVLDLIPTVKDYDEDIAELKKEIKKKSKI